MTRRRRLLKPMRSAQRAERATRNRKGRQLWRGVRRVLAEHTVTVSGPPSTPWADPAYQKILADIAANLNDPKAGVIITGGRQ